MSRSSATTPPGRTKPHRQQKKQPRRYPCRWCCLFFDPAVPSPRQWPPPAPQIVSICARLSRLHHMPPEIRQAHRNATGSRRRAVKRQKSRDTCPQRKTPPAAVKMGKRGQRPPPAPYACARVYSAPGCIQYNTRPSQRGATALMLSAPSSKRQHQSRPDQTRPEPSRAPQRSPSKPRGQPKRSEGRGVTRRGMFSRGQRTAAAAPARHPARDRRSAGGKWRFARHLASLAACRCDNGCYCNGAEHG